jgi:hypothetical protein
MVLTLTLALPAMAILPDRLRAQEAETPFNLGRAQDIAARPMALGGSYTGVASAEWLLTLRRCITTPPA